MTKMRFAAVAAMVAAICASGCAKSNQTASSAATAGSASPSAAGEAQQASSADADGIRAAIEEHVRNDRGVNMDMLEMTIDSVSVSGNQAHAQARFSPKQGGTGMAMTYLLERQSGGWVVTSGQPTDSQFAHPPTDGAHSGMPANPSGPAMPDLTDFLRNKPSNSKN
ncbi:MAG TPA: hypothetical protein VMB47_05320 [Candidatus Aquilonibacter sp.]|nr:hypothetical protein [Candidatus Aquilonibacter sp.]